MAGTVKIAIVADAARAKAEMASTGQSAGALGKRFSALGSTIKAAFAAGAVAGTGFLVAAVKKASDLNETSSKSTTLFGKQAKAMDKWAANAARTTGLSKSAALNAAAGFGDMFQQIGFSGKAAAKLSRSSVQMAADLGSFSNVEPADVAERISAAYRGEFDSLQALIPGISAARVEQEALALTHKKSAKNLTAQDKALAVNAILHKDGARAMGDFSRTSGGLANVTRTVQAGFENLSAKVGTAFLPGVTAAGVAVRDKLLPALDGLVTKYAPQVNAFITKAAASGFGIQAISDRISGIDFGKAAEAVKGIGTSLGKVDYGKAGAALGQIGTALGQLAGAGGDGVNSTLTVTGVVMGQLADHSDLLAKSIPVLTGAVLAYKVGQLAANVASLAAVPLKVAELVVNRQLVASNQALVASRVAATAATVGGNGAETVSIATRARSVVSMIAQRAVMVAGAVVTGVMTAAQWALNVAMTANPIGLVILAIVALVAGLVIAYQKSATFRGIVDGLWAALKRAGAAVWEFVQKAIKYISGLPAAVSTAFSSAKESLSRIGSQVVDGFRSGISGAWEGFLGWVRGKIDSLPYVVKKVLGIASPSKVFKSIGKWVPLGFLGGLKATFPQVDAYLVKWSKTAASRLSIKAVQASATKTATSVIADVKAKVAAQRQVVADLVKARSDYAKTVADSLKGQGVLGVDLTTSVHSYRADALIQGLKDRLKAVRSFTTGIDVLRKKGLGPGLLQQIVDSGVDGGATIVDALRNATPAVLAQIRALDAQVARESTLFGNRFSGTVFNPQINAAQAKVTAPVVIELKSSGAKIDDLLLEILRKAIRVRGGNVQVVLAR